MHYFSKWAPLAHLLQSCLCLADISWSFCCLLNMFVPAIKNCSDNFSGKLRAMSCKTIPALLSFHSTESLQGNQREGCLLFPVEANMIFCSCKIVLAQCMAGALPPLLTLWVQLLLPPWWGLNLPIWTLNDSQRGQAAAMYAFPTF